MDPHKIKQAIPHARTYVTKPGMGRIAVCYVEDADEMLASYWQRNENSPWLEVPDEATFERITLASSADAIEMILSVKAKINLN